MNARKRRPARRKPQRWRAWGCAFAMGIVATPITTTQVLANSQPLANWAAVVAWSGNQPMPHSSGSDSFGTVHQPPRDLWGDVDDSPAYRSAGTVAETPAESEDAAQQDLWKDDTKEPAPIEPAMPREWQAPAGDASPLPPADPSSEITRLDFRQRMIATMGWTTVASHSSDVCRTPGSPGKASQSAESSAQEILDGFRAKGLGRRAVARSSTSAPAPTNPTSLHSSPSLKQPIRSAKKPPRVTSVDSPEVTAPHTIQADFRLEPVEPDANGLAAKIAPNVVQLSGAGSPGERLTSVSAEIVELSDIAKLPAELPRTAAPTEAAPAQPASSFTLAPPQADRLAAVQIPKNSKRLPEPSLGLGGVKSGVSDEEPAIGTSQPTRLPPTKMPLLRGPVFGGVSDHDDPSTIVGKAERAPIRESVADTRSSGRAGVTDKNDPIRTGVTDLKEPIRAGVTDKREPVRAGASDESLAVKAGVSDEGQPVRAGVSDVDGPESKHPAGAPSAELVIMPAMEIGQPRTPKRVGVSDLEELTSGVNPDDRALDSEESSEIPDHSPTKPGTNSLVIVESVSDDDLTTVDSDVLPELLPSAEEPQNLSFDVAEPRKLPEPALPHSGDDEPYYEREPLEWAEQNRAGQPSAPLSDIAPGLDDSRSAKPQLAKSPATYGVSDLDDEPADGGSLPEGLIRLDLTSRSAADQPSRQRVTATGLGGDRGATAARSSGQELVSHGKMQLALRQGKLVRTTHEIARTEVVNSAICEVVQFNTDEISVIGKQAGQTHVRVWFRGQTDNESTNYLVTVGSRPDAGRPEAEEQEQLIATLTERYPDANFEVITQGDRVVVRGEVRRNEDAVQILSQIRRAWLVPVEDRLVVKR